MGGYRMGDVAFALNTSDGIAYGERGVVEGPGSATNPVQVRFAKGFWHLKPELLSKVKPQERPAVGDSVQLASGVPKSRSGNGGPLKPGDVGQLLKDDNSKQPFRVKDANGKNFWYYEDEIHKSSKSFAEVVSVAQAQGPMIFHL